MNIQKAIDLIYPDLNLSKGGFTYSLTNSGKEWDNPIDGLKWDNTELSKPTWADIESKFTEVDLSEAKDIKKEELETYHNSDTARKVIVGTHIVYNRFSFRGLIDEQKDKLNEKIALGVITEAQAIFNYQYNGSGLIPLTLLQLRLLAVGLKDLADANYNVRVAHRNAIDTLTTVADIEAYDFTANYVINQAFTL